MVGGRSFGCRTCKQRRIKCDERMPICFQCEKSRRHCTGPQSPFRYQYGSEDQHKKLMQALDLTNESIPKVTIQHEKIHASRIQAELEMPIITAPVTFGHTERLAASLVAVLSSSCSIGYQIQQLGPYVLHLPARIGHSRALDTSIELFLHSYNFVVSGQAVGGTSTLALYGSAVRALREELSAVAEQSPTATPSETLCAGLVLAHHEPMNRKPTDSYVTIAGGVSAIFRGRGPNGLTSDFDIAMFISHYPALITQAVLKGDECFLDTAQWNALMRLGTPRHGAENNLINLWISYAKYPGQLQRMKSLWVGGDPDTIDTVNHDYHPLLTNMYELRDSFLLTGRAIAESLSEPKVFQLCPAAYTGYPAPLSFTHSQPISKNDSLRVYRAIDIGIFYHACMISVNVALQRLLPVRDDMLAEETFASARAIVDMFSFAATWKPFGALGLTWAGPMAYGVLKDVPEKLQLLHKINATFETLGFMHSHRSLSYVFNAMTGVPLWDRETAVFEKSFEMV